jgi:hypothetical protein
MDARVLQEVPAVAYAGCTAAAQPTAGGTAAWRITHRSPNWSPHLHWVPEASKLNRVCGGSVHMAVVSTRMLHQ